MGVIATLGRYAWRFFAIDGSPSSGAQRPKKVEIFDFVDAVDREIVLEAEMRVLGDQAEAEARIAAVTALGSRVDTVEDTVAGYEATADSVLKATWSALSAVTGTRSGQRGLVPTSDAGTHTDPVVGGTVANSGTFSWSTSPAGWQRIDAYQDTSAVQTEVSNARQGELTLVANLAAMKAATQVAASQTLGAPTTPVTGTALAAGIYIIEDAVTADGILLQFQIFSQGSGTAYLRREILVGTDYLLVAPEVPITLAAGLNTLTPTHFGIFPVHAGDRVSIRFPTSLGYYLAGSAYSGGYRTFGSGPNALSIVRNPALQSLVRLQMQWVLASGAPAEAVAARWQRPAAETFLEQGVQKVGRFDTMATGSALARKNYVFGYNPAAADGVITGLPAFVLTAGVGFAQARTRVGDVWKQIGPSYPVYLPAGAINLADSLPFIPVPKGAYLGWYPETCVIAWGATGSGAQIAEGPAGVDVREFTDSTVANTPSCQIGFEISLGQAAIAKRRAKAKRPITAWGDSMSHDVTNGFPAKLRLAMQDRQTISYGVPAQTSSQVLARTGAVPALITVTGDEIPTSGAVAVTAITVDPINAYSILDGYALPGKLCGIEGSLARASSGTGSYTFTRSEAGLAIPCAPATPFVPRRGALYNGDIHELWVGRNDTLANLMTTTLNNVLAFVDKYGVENVLIIGVCTKSDGTEDKGSTAYGQIVAFNNHLAARYGAHFVDLRREMIRRGLSIAGISATTDDDDDLDADVIPDSLMADSTHFDADGNTAAAAIVSEAVAVAFDRAA